MVTLGWLAVIFTSFGLYAPTDSAVVVTMLVSSLSVAAAIHPAV